MKLPTLAVLLAANVSWALGFVVNYHPAATVTACRSGAFAETGGKDRALQSVGATTQKKHHWLLLGASVPSDQEMGDQEDDSIFEQIAKPAPAKTTSFPVELIGVAAWVVAISSFLITNNFAGPWPADFVLWCSPSVWLLLHSVGGMLFGGGVILTTLIEWLVVDSAIAMDTREADGRNKDSALPVLHFWFNRVPLLDLSVVVPALTIAIFSGTGLAVENYGSLGAAPRHVTGALELLISFAVWWAATDLTTQEKAKEALVRMQKDQDAQVPRVLLLRRISNIVSCAFVFGLYVVMVLKPDHLLL